MSAASAGPHASAASATPVSRIFFIRYPPVWLENESGRITRSAPIWLSHIGNDRFKRDGSNQLIRLGNWNINTKGNYLPDGPLIDAEWPRPSHTAAAQRCAAQIVPADVVLPRSEKF